MLSKKWTIILIAVFLVVDVVLSYFFIIYQPGLKNKEIAVPPEVNSQNQIQPQSPVVKFDNQASGTRWETNVKTELLAGRYPQSGVSDGIKWTRALGVIQKVIIAGQKYEIQISGQPKITIVIDSKTFVGQAKYGFNSEGVLVNLEYKLLEEPKFESFVVGQTVVVGYAVDNLKNNQVVARELINLPVAK